MSFNFKIDTEVAGSSILNILFTLFHITLDLYIKVLSGGGVMIKRFLCPRVENLYKLCITIGLLNFRILNVSLAQ